MNSRPRAASGLMQSALVVCRMGVALMPLLVSAGASAQDPQPKDQEKEKETISGGYVVHQSFDMGVRIMENAGSLGMYDTLVNLQSGPRILGQTFDMHTVAGTYHPLFDNLSESSSGYGGDPYNVTTLRMSKGKIYR